MFAHPSGMLLCTVIHVFPSDLKVTCLPMLVHSIDMLQNFKISLIKMGCFWYIYVHPFKPDVTGLPMTVHPNWMLLATWLIPCCQFKSSEIGLTMAVYQSEILQSSFVRTACNWFIHICPSNGMLLRTQL